MAQVARIFVSHSREDTGWCTDFVAALAKAKAADVWYDKDNLGFGRLRDVIGREIVERPIFVVVVSTASVNSRWVQDEVNIAIDLEHEDPDRVVLPVVAEKVNLPPFWRPYRRLTGPNEEGLPAAEAAAEVIRFLALVPTSEPEAPVPPVNAETAAQAYERGRGLRTQRRPVEALDAYRRAISLDQDKGIYWRAKGLALRDLTQYEPALVAFEVALVLDPSDAYAWNGKGVVLWQLKRHQEALDAFTRGLTISPRLAFPWNNKINLLTELGRKAEASETRRQRDAALGKK